MPSNKVSLAGRVRKMLVLGRKSHGLRGVQAIVLRSASIVAISNARVVEAKAVALRKVAHSRRVRRVVGASQRLPNPKLSRRLRQKSPDFRAFCCSHVVPPTRVYGVLLMLSGP